MMTKKEMTTKKMIINVDSQLKEVNRHPWVIAGGKGEMDLEDPMMEVCFAYSSC